MTQNAARTVLFQLILESANQFLEQERFTHVPEGAPSGSFSATYPFHVQNC